MAKIILPLLMASVAFCSGCGFWLGNSPPERNNASVDKVEKARMDSLEVRQRALEQRMTALEESVKK
jgi:hypothetical protein